MNPIQATQAECSSCGEKIFGTYYTVDDKVFCEADYKVSIIAAVSEVVTNISEKSWELPEMPRSSGWSDYKDFFRPVPPQLFLLCGKTDW